MSESHKQLGLLENRDTILDSECRHLVLSGPKINLDILNEKSNRLTYQQNIQRLTPQAKSHTLTIGQKLVSQSLQELEDVAGIIDEFE